MPWQGALHIGQLAIFGLALLLPTMPKSNPPPTLSFVLESRGGCLTLVQGWKLQRLGFDLPEQRLPLRLGSMNFCWLLAPRAWKFRSSFGALVMLSAFSIAASRSE